MILLYFYFTPPRTLIDLNTLLNKWYGTFWHLKVYPTPGLAGFEGDGVGVWNFITYTNNNKIYSRIERYSKVVP